jgi:hypothetical protein
VGGRANKVRPHKQLISLNMKPKTKNFDGGFALAMSALLSFNSAVAQSALTDTEETAIKASAAGYSIQQRGANDRVWLKTSSCLNAAGELSVTTNSFIEVATAMHYNENGEWKESRDLIELTSEGAAAATRGPCKAYFGQNLAGPEGIRLVSRTGLSAQTRPLGLFYHDVASGKTVQLAALRDCGAELLPPNQIVWKGIFDTMDADFRVTYTKALIEGDLILKQRPKPPQAYDPGLDPATTRLELWHEWHGLRSPKQRQITVNRPAAVEAGGSLRTVQDNLLDFGDLFFAHGNAFACGAGEARPANSTAQVRIPNPQASEHIPVAKEWHEMADHSILVEAVYWPDLEPKVGDLPEMAASTPPMAKDRLLCLREVALPAPLSQTSKPIQVAKAEYRPSGAVLDWIIISDAGWDYNFMEGWTYYISYGYFGGKVIFGKRAVLKFAPGVWLLLYGTVECHGSGSIENTVLTSRDDDLFGERLDGLSTHYPTYTADAALWNYYATEPMDFRFMRIRWAHTGVQCDWSQTTLFACKLEMCERGLEGSPIGTAFSTACGVLALRGSLTDICPGDVDEDDLPDWWECGYFGNKTAAEPNADTDADCWSNLEEYLFERNPRDFPEFTFQPSPIEQARRTGEFAYYWVATTILPGNCQGFQWYRKPQPFENFTAIPGATNDVLQIDNLSMADCGFYMVQVTNDWATNESSVARLYVNDDFWQAVWDSYQAYDAWQENSYHVWAQKSRPPGWPTVKPLLAWNANTVLSRFTNRSAIAGDMWYNSGAERIAYVALSRRHALFRGHGTGTHCYFKPEWAGRKVWFCPPDNSQVVEATVANGYTFDRAYCPQDDADYSIVIFDEDLEGIVPAKVMVPPPGWGLVGHVNYFAPADDTSVGVWVDQVYGAGTGPSASPMLIPAPYPDNSLVLVGAVDTSPVSPGWQTIMDRLCDELDDPIDHVPLTWYAYP